MSTNPEELVEIAKNTLKEKNTLKDNLNEIYTTENTFVNDIWKAIKELGAKNNKDSDVDFVYSSLNNLYEIIKETNINAYCAAMKLPVDLSSLSSQDKIKYINDYYKSGEFIYYSKAIEDYIVNKFPRCQAILGDDKHNKLFKKFKVDNKDLLSFLITPVQRMPRHVLLTEQAEKQIRKVNAAIKKEPEHLVSLSESIKNVKVSATNINEGFRSKEQADSVPNYFDSFQEKFKSSNTSKNSERAPFFDSLFEGLTTLNKDGSREEMKNKANKDINSSFKNLENSTKDVHKKLALAQFRESVSLNIDIGPEAMQDRIAELALMDLGYEKVSIRNRNKTKGPVRNKIKALQREELTELRDKIKIELQKKAAAAEEEVEAAAAETVAKVEEVAEQEQVVAEQEEAVAEAVALSPALEEAVAEVVAAEVVPAAAERKVLKASATQNELEEQTKQHNAQPKKRSQLRARLKPSKSTQLGSVYEEIEEQGEIEALDFKEEHYSNKSEAAALNQNADPTIARHEAMAVKTARIKDIQNDPGFKKVGNWERLSNWLTRNSDKTKSRELERLKLVITLKKLIEEVKLDGKAESQARQEQAPLVAPPLMSEFQAEAEQQAVTQAATQVVKQRVAAPAAHVDLEKAKATQAALEGERRPPPAARTPQQRDAEQTVKAPIKLRGAPPPAMGARAAAAALKRKQRSPTSTLLKQVQEDERKQKQTTTNNQRPPPPPAARTPEQRDAAQTVKAPIKLRGAPPPARPRRAQPPPRVAPPPARFSNPDPQGGATKDVSSKKQPIDFFNKNLYQYLFEELSGIKPIGARRAATKVGDLTASSNISKQIDPAANEPASSESGVKQQQEEVVDDDSKQKPSGPGST